MKKHIPIKDEQLASLAKEHCAQENFKDISTDDVKFKIVSNYEE